MAHLTPKDKKSLPKFNFYWYRLPEYLGLLDQEVESLQIANTVVGIINNNSSDIDQGTLFITGKKYFIAQVEVGDDFTGTGFTTEGEVFTSNGVQPPTWDNDTIVRNVDVTITQIYNDLDENIYIDYVSENIYTINVTNNGFVENKTFPNIIAGSEVDVTSTNSITYNAESDPKYFKIEVYI